MDNDRHKMVEWGLGGEGIAEAFKVKVQEQWPSTWIKK